MKMEQSQQILPLNIGRVVSGSLIVAGTAIGAGMLGIPFVTAKAGIAGAFVITVAVWMFMLLTGLYFAEVSLAMPRGSNILSITKKFLGQKTSLFAGGMFLFLYYCLMIAYFSGSAPLLQNLLRIVGLEVSTGLSTILFTFLFSGIIYLGARAVDRTNSLLMIGMGVFYFLLLGVGLRSSVNADLSLQWMPMLGAVPILFGAFGYHNVIPTLCDYLEQDKKALQLSIVIGTVLALGVYLSWQGLILLNVPIEIIESTLREGKTSVFALQQAVQNERIAQFASCFSICALLTSILGVGLSLVDFLRDGFLTNGKKMSRGLLVLFAFFPPLTFCLTNESIFYKALGWAGGFGEAFLNGALPILLVWSYRSRLSFTFIPLLIIAIGVMAIEIFY